MVDTVRVFRGGMMETLPPQGDGMSRRVATADDLVVVDLTIEPKSIPGWHHHGERLVYAFINAGTLRLEYGAGGRECVEMTSGDFYIIPPGFVHRESNLGTEELEILGVLVGSGPTVAYVDGPEEG